MYEIINWQPAENGTVDFVTVGLYDATLPNDKQMNLYNKTIIWMQNSLEVKSYTAANASILCILGPLFLQLYNFKF